MTFTSYDATLGGVVIDVVAIRAAVGSDKTGGVLARALNAATGPWTTVRGAGAVVITVSSLPIEDYEFTPGVANFYKMTYSGGSQSDNVTPNLAGPWLMNLRYPFLNQQVSISDASDITRPARGAAFSVIARSGYVGIATARGARSYTLTAYTDTDTGNMALQALLSTGDTVLVQVPPDYLVPVLGGYFTVGDSVETLNGVPWPLRWTQIPLTEVEPPDSSVVPITCTWETVTNAYTTWSAVVSALGTWDDVVELIGSPSDVIVS